MKIKKEKLSKRTNRKQNFKKFVESGYTDIRAFLAACKNDENLLIYTCLTQEELLDVIEKMKQQEGGLEEQIKYLVNNQPTMNETPERFDRVKTSIFTYLKGYLSYNAWRMNNGIFSAEDWEAEFWAKYCKVCNFYYVRWFKPDELKKESTVSYTPMLYKEFIYIVRLSISSERKHQAFLATQNPDATIFKLSLDAKVDVGDSEKSLAEVVADEVTSFETLVEDTNISSIITKALSIIKQYPDANKHYDEIKRFYDVQDTEYIVDTTTKEKAHFDKKIVMLGKIFLYKAGLVSPKTLAFIKTLSSTYKCRYNISNARINAQINEFKSKKQFTPKITKKKKEELTYRDLILKKRGEL